MTRHLGIAALAVLLLAAARADPPTSRGTLRGAVEGSFRCAVEARAAGEVVALTITALEPAGEVLALAPGAFQVGSPLAPRRYALADLIAARASVTTRDGTLYSATKTSRSRGEVTLTLRQVEGPVAGRYQAHGAVQVELLPSGSPKADRVTIEIEF